jgi:two-component system response regulator HydG
MADTPADALELLREGGGDLVMIDVLDADVAGFMASLRAERFTIPVLACGIHASAERAVAAIRAGARDYVPLPPQRELIAAAIASVVERKRPVRIGEHPALARALALATRGGAEQRPVLVTGEKGSGKEVMARAIHEASGRADPMIVVECAGVGADVLESELFGHEAGAFPGAVARRIGRLEKAGHGTIFLREVGSALARAPRPACSTRCRSSASTRIGGDEAGRFPRAADRLDQHRSRSVRSIRRQLPRRSARPPRPGPRRGAAARRARRRHRRSSPSISRHVSPKPTASAARALHRRRARYCCALWLAGQYPRARGMHPPRRSARPAEPPSNRQDLVRSDGTPLIELELAEPDRLQIESLIGRTVEEVERELILHTLERCHGNRTSASSILGISVRTMRNKLRTFIEAGIAVAAGDS